MRFRKITYALVSVAAVCGVTGAATPSYAAPQDLTQGFHVTNLTGYKMTLVKAADNVEGGGPQANSSLSPGEAHDFEVIYHFAADTPSKAQYEIWDDKGGLVGQAKFDFKVDLVNAPTSSCTIVSGPFKCDGGGKDLKLLDAQPVTRDVPASDAQKEADLLNRYCADGGPADCNFSANKEENTTLPGKPWGKAVANNTDQKVSTTLAVSHTVSNEDLVEGGFKIGAKLSEKINAEVWAKYSHTWTNSTTYSQSVQIDVAPHREAWVEEAIPVIRFTGDFNVRIGNTTWKLHDIKLDTPDDTAAGQTVYTVKDKPLSSQQLKELPKAVTRVPA